MTDLLRRGAAAQRHCARGGVRSRTLFPLAQPIPRAFRTSTRPHDDWKKAYHKPGRRLTTRREAPSAVHRSTSRRSRRQSIPSFTPPVTSDAPAVSPEQLVLPTEPLTGWHRTHTRTGESVPRAELVRCDGASDLLSLSSRSWGDHFQDEVRFLRAGVVRKMTTPGGPRGVADRLALFLSLAR